MGVKTPLVGCKVAGPLGAAVAMTGIFLLSLAIVGSWLPSSDG
ncbi:MAG: hypothetical protein QW057_03730 [Candidatus Bathyarchaeia archaeon]